MIRVKSRWFKTGRKKTPQEIAGALAFITWRISDNALKHVRKADFDIAIGDQYFAFLSEFLIFLVQVADRIVYTQLDAQARFDFTTALANKVAVHMAENQAEWLGKPVSEYKQIFIKHLNQRAGEYAEFEYSGVDTSFTFVRYLGHCMRDLVDEKDKAWVIDQIMATEVPDAVDMLVKAMTGLFDDSSKPPRSAVSIAE